MPVPPSAVTPAAITPVEPPTPSPERRVVPDRPATPGAPAGSPAIPIAPPPRQQDSTTAAGAGAPTARPAVEAPRAVFPVQPCDLACEVRRSEAAGGKGGGGTLTTAQRDSARREVGRRVVDAPRQPSEANVAADRPSTGAPVEQHGVSIPVGLPGGGPTAAQRKRTRALDAEVSARLARIKARADSLERAASDSAAAAGAGRKP